MTRARGNIGRPCLRCVAVTALAVRTLGIDTVVLPEVGRLPRALNGWTYGNVHLRLHVALNMMS